MAISLLLLRKMVPYYRFCSSKFIRRCTLMRHKLYENNYESKARASLRGGVGRKPAPAWRGTPRASKARAPRTSGHDTAKSGESGGRVKAPLVQRPLPFFSGESSGVSWEVAGHGN